MIVLSAIDLTLAAALVLALAFASWARRLGFGRDLVIAGVRATLQLLLIGFVLKTLFEHAQPWWVALAAALMALAAGWEIRARQRKRERGSGGLLVAAGTAAVTAFSVTLLTLIVIVQPTPWYTPQYAIPLLGMILGKVMTGIALALDTLVSGVTSQRALIEQRLMLGHSPAQATHQLRSDAVRTALIPIVNAMAVAGIVSLPGTMTGQILAGAPPIEAIKYQLLIMFVAAAAIGGGALLAVQITTRRLFDERDRLRLDRYE